MSLNSKIILVKNIKVDKNYINVLSYSESQMVTLCEQNAVATANDYSFIRSNKSIMVNFSYSQCLQANYIAFQNTDYSNKWFFAWIDEVIYKGEECTEIKYTVDAWSTWFSYWNKNSSCYVVRQHVNDDIIGSNTKPEPVNLGKEYVVENEINKLYGENMEVGFLVGAKDSDVVSGTYYNKIYAGTGLEWGLSGSGNINTALNKYKDDFSRIISLFQYPKVLHSATNQIYEDVIEFDESETFGNFTPKNKKLLTYPFKKLSVVSSDGNSIDLQYELFSEKKLKIQGALMPAPKMYCFPTNYRGLAEDVGKIVSFNPKIDLTWSYGTYENWLNRNASAQNIASLSNVISTGLSIAGTVANPELSAVKAGLNIAGSISSGVISGANTINTFANARKGSGITNFNSASEGLNVAINNFGFRVYQEAIKEEYARQVDNYFTRFGYSIDDIVEPNITGRPIFNYLEINQFDSIGEQNNFNNISVNSTDMETINNACRKGVTIWHNHDNVGNYSLDNTIV